MRKALGVAALCAAVALLAPGAHAATNLIVNGSFELPVIGAGTGANGSPQWWQVINPDDWSSAGTAAEIQQNIWQAQHGIQYIELDSHGSNTNVEVFQDVQVYAGNTYYFSFWWSPRPNVAASSNGFEWYINDPLSNPVLFGSGSAAGANVPMGQSNDPGWRNVTGSFTAATTGLYTVGFKGTGTQDTYGVFIDNVSLVVPVPAAAGLGLVGMGLLPLVRRRKAPATK